MAKNDETNSQNLRCSFCGKHLDNILSIVNNNRNELKTPVPEEEAHTEAYNESTAQSEDSSVQDTQEDILESIDDNDNIPE